MSLAAEAPVGIFDSGIGGWCVLREIRRELPAEALLYVADSAFAPYGDRSNAFIAARATAIAQFLIGKGAKALVVACNTATSAAVTSLRETCNVPIVAMEPAVKPAAALTRSGVIGVLATRRTVEGEQFSRLNERYAGEITVLAQACPGLVEQIETGDFDSLETRSLIQRYVRPLLMRKADVLVLGCTHYPLVRGQIEACAGAGVAVIDPAPAVARELKRRLAGLDLLAANDVPPRPLVYTTGQAVRLQSLLVALGQSGVTPQSVTIGVESPSMAAGRITLEELP